MAAVFHAEKLVHPSASLDVNYDTTLGRLIASATDVHLVDGLTDGSGTQNQTVMDRAINAAGTPKVGTPYVGSLGKAGCVLTGYSVLPIPQSDDSIYLLLRYSTPVVQGPLQNVNVIAIEYDTFTRTVPTIMLPSGEQLVIMPPKDPTRDPASIFPPDATPKPAFTAWEETLTRMTAAVRIQAGSKNLDAVRNAVGSVNNRQFFGFPRGYWKFDNFRETFDTSTTTSGNYVTLQCEFLCRRLFNWYHLEIWRSEYLGLPQPVDDSTLKKATALSTGEGYEFGQVNLPGITLVGNNPLANLGGVFGVGNYNQWLNGRPGINRNS